MTIYLKTCALIMVSSILAINASDDGNNQSRILSRRKRYVAFPEGSSFSCAGCMTVGIIGQPMSVPGTFTWGLNWGVAYELPNTTEAANFYRFFKRRKKPVEQRRSRRQLYQKIEAVMDKMGYNGRQCILKTLCETTQRIIPHGENMIEEMFRILFTVPMARVLPTEPLEHSIYDSAHRLGTLLDNCEAFTCPVSLVDLAKGYYNTPAQNLDMALKPWALLAGNYG